MSNEPPPSIVEVLRKARDTGGLVRITGYRNSDGAVSDYTVKLIGSEGYRALVQASLKMLMNDEIEKPKLVDGDTWLLAKQEKTDSWGKTLNSEHVPNQRQEQFKDVDGLYSQSEYEPETVMLRNLELVAKVEQELGSGKTPNSQAKTLAKKYIDENTPMGRYLGQMKLAPGKFDSVTNLE